MSRDRRRAILDAATRMFSQHGVRRASVDLIAGQAQVAKPTIYAHFGDKDGLFVAVCAAVGERILAEARYAAASDRSVVDRVTAILAAKFSLVFELAQSSPYAEELLRPASAAARESIAAADAAYRRVLADVLGRAAKAGELDLRHLGLSTAELVSQLLQIGFGASYGATSIDEQRRNLRALVTSHLRVSVGVSRRVRQRP